MTIELEATAKEQTRARYPDESGYVERDGVRVFYEVYGSGEPTILFCPTWTLVHSRVWKMQIPYLARHCRVLTFDGRGSGRSARPASGYEEREFAADALAVMDATGTDGAVVVGLPQPSALLLAAEHPERVLGAVLIGPWFPASRSLGGVRYRMLAHPWGRSMFTRRPIVTRSWAKVNAVHFRRDFRDFVEWFAGMCTSEAHSTKGFDDVVEWGLQTDPDTLAMTVIADGAAPVTRRDQLALARRVKCPVLVISGKKDKVTSHADARALARARRKAGGDRGWRSPPEGRQPVTVNLAIREFVDSSFRRNPTVERSSAGGARCTSALRSASAMPAASRDRPRAAGAAPDLEIDWLAQDPVTRVLKRRASASILPAGTWPTSRPTSKRSPPSTACSASRPSGAWTRSWPRTTWSSTTSSARRRMTSGSAMRPGSSTTTCTRTQTESAHPSPG
jgi:pimeloyl-ACP methyl ester carboxylesterase